MGGARTASLLGVVLLGASLTSCGFGGHDAPGTARTDGLLSGRQYVALGDSYTAAPGIGRSVGTKGCFRSVNDYPQRVAEATGAILVDNSCVGANTKAIDGQQTTIAGTTVPAQDAALGDSTALVTIGIGANDFTLYNLISTVCPTLATKHPTGSPCTHASRQSTVTVPSLLRKVQARLVAVVRVVRDLAPHARILLIGYPSVVPARGTCHALPLAAGDYPFARSIIVGLDRAMSRAAATTATTYVDTAGPTRGHDICGRDPWIAGSTARKGAGVPWHPYAPEQELVARLVVRALH